MTNTTNTAAASGAADNCTILPDGSAFAVGSFPLPQDHWLYAPHEYEPGADEPKELLAPILTHAQRNEVVAAVRYAVRGATMCGKDPDFDPDALVQNAVYALCGSFGRTALAAPAQPAPQQEAQEQAAVVVPCHTPSGKRVALYSARQDLPIGTQLYTAPQPSPAAQRDALDAARYRWLRNECARHDGLTVAKVGSWGLDGWSGDDLTRAIDAARAAQEGGKA